MILSVPVRPGLDAHVDVDVDVRDAGHGDPVLVLHGAAGPDSIQQLVIHLASHRRVLAPTHPGFAGTARPDGLEGITQLARAYLDLLDGLRLDGVSVVGASMGGWVAAEMATADLDGRITRLALIDAIGPRIEGQPVTMPQSPPSTSATPGGPPQAAMAAMRAYTGSDMHDPTLLDRVARVHTPTLLLWGQNDPVVPPAFGRAYAMAFPNARFVVIPEGGHLPWREAPQQTIDTLSAFLDEGHPQP